MTQDLPEHHAGKNLPDQAKVWNSLRDIYTWRVWYFDHDGQVVFHDYLGTREQAINTITENNMGNAVFKVQHWDSSMPDIEITNKDKDA